jgi:sulfatase modifying factor 1
MSVSDLVDGRPATKARAPVTSDAPAHPGMVWVSGGTFRMGSDHHYAEEAPAHESA